MTKESHERWIQFATERETETGVQQGLEILCNGLNHEAQMVQGKREVDVERHLKKDLDNKVTSVLQLGGLGR